jgi:hypothetical protein
LKDVCSIGAIHMPAPGPEALHAVCALTVVGARHSTMAIATLLVLILVTNARGFRVPAYKLARMIRLLR